MKIMVWLLSRPDGRGVNSERVQTLRLQTLTHKQRYQPTMTLSPYMTNRAASFGYDHHDLKSIGHLSTLAHKFAPSRSSSTIGSDDETMMDLSDEVSADTTITGKDHLLTPYQTPINIVDATPDDFCAEDVVRSLKSSFEEALCISALIAAETTVLGKHSLTPRPIPDQATANVTDAAAKDLWSHNSVFTPSKEAQAVNQDAHLITIPSDPPRRQAPLIHQD